MELQPGGALAAPRIGLHRFACLTAACTLVLIFAGGMVTSTGSGLAVPDWPLSFGQVFPDDWMSRTGVFYEHGHRLIASFVGLLTVILAAWVVLAEQRTLVRALGLMAALAVVFQGILGGVTVLYKLPPAVSILHACTAQAFLMMATGLAVVTGPGWLGRRSIDATVGLRRLAIATTAMIYAQLILGATVRHTGAGLAIPDFPLAFGRLVPDLSDVLVRIQFLHRLGAVAVFVLVILTVSRALTLERAGSWIRRPALLLGGLVVVQITLGALTIWQRKPPIITTSHVAVGATLLATSLILTLHAHRPEPIA